MNYPTRNEFQNQPELHPPERTDTAISTATYVDMCVLLEFIARYA